MSGYYIPRQPVAFFNARLIDIATENGGDVLVFEYQGQEMRRPTFAGSAERAAEKKAAGTPPAEFGKVGVVIRADWPSEERDFPEYRFEAYIDQSLRRSFELDIFEHVEPVGSPRFNAERIGWRNEACPDGFLAPAGIIPGENGRFIEDSTEALELDVPAEFVSLCAEFKRTPEDVLRGFIADAASLMNYVREPRADGYSSNGSDERRLAYEYIERAYGMWRDD
ncbi:TPA: hypothetical protein NI803_004583 [Pseudomonas aeruginosa]|nr:hypothetical protein [Pseudomonas aeruginosa]